MSVLALLLPPRERLSARGVGADSGSGAALRLPTEWPYVFSADGRAETQHASAALSLLPRADQVVLVLAEADVSWHRITVPKAPPARLRAALLGVLEDALLEDDEALHFALSDAATGGAPGWVAVTHRPRLVTALAALEAAGLTVERVVAASEPVADVEGALSHGHFFSRSDEGPEAVPWLSLARPDGVACVRLNGALARALQPAEGSVRWTATPQAAASAEQWLGAPVAVLTEAERSLQAVQARTNLRQFDLAARHRGTRALGQIAKRFFSTEWRPVRMALVALVMVQLVGLNAYAWRQQHALDAKRTAMTDLLKASHPGVRTVLNAPAQMRSETERLRAAAGRPGDADLEALMGVAAAAWPDGQGAVQSLRYEAGRLSLAAAGFGEPQMQQLRERLRGSGFVAELAEGRITISRAAPPARSST